MGGFNVQTPSGQNVDLCVTEPKRWTNNCAFGNLTQSLIRGRIICCIADTALQDRLLCERDLSLENTMQMSRTVKAVAAELNAQKRFIHEVDMKERGQKRPS